MYIPAAFSPVSLYNPGSVAAMTATSALSTAKGALPGVSYRSVGRPDNALVRKDTAQNK